MTTKKPGRPAYEADEKTRAQVKMLAAMGVPDYDIAKVIGVSSPTLRKHYMAELETGHIEANAQVAQSLFKQATNKDKPNVSAAIFWLKCRAEWREDGKVSIRARHRWRAIRFARNSLLSNHIFDVQREHDDQAHLVARRRHKSTDQFQQTQ